MKKFTASDLKDIYLPHKNSSGEDNGQVTIIGGSRLFHGPPFLAIRAASRIVDMVFFSSPEESLRDVSANLKASIQSFIWVPFEEVGDYIKKSDAVLVGPGFMRASTEKNNHKPALDDADFELSRSITKKLLASYPTKKWVIDAGSLQTMEANWIPKNAILTPNKKEYKMLFGDIAPEAAAKKYDCVIVLKGPVSYVYTPSECFEVRGGNAGMTKGGTGDAMAGLTVGLLAKNEPFLAASAGAFITKAAGDTLYKSKNVYYNADDLSEQIPLTFAQLAGE